MNAKTRQDGRATTGRASRSSTRRARRQTRRTPPPRDRPQSSSGSAPDCDDAGERERHPWRHSECERCPLRHRCGRRRRSGRHHRRSPRRARRARSPGAARTAVCRSEQGPRSCSDGEVCLGDEPSSAARRDARVPVSSAASRTRDAGSRDVRTRLLPDPSAGRRRRGARLMSGRLDVEEDDSRGRAPRSPRSRPTRARPLQERARGRRAASQHCLRGRTKAWMVIDDEDGTHRSRIVANGAVSGSPVNRTLRRQPGTSTTIIPSSRTRTGYVSTGM